LVGFAGFACGFGGVASIRFSVSLNCLSWFFSALGADLAKAKQPSKFLLAGTKTGLPDDVLIKIGEITLNWNRAEGVLEELIWIIAGWGRSVGAFVTHDLGNVSRDQLCRNLLHHRLRDEKLKAELLDTLSFVALLRTHRNNLIHSIPTLQLGTDTIAELEKRSTVKRRAILTP
jgi:hypothetical protein